VVTGIGSNYSFIPSGHPDRYPNPKRATEGERKNALMGSVDPSRSWASCGNPTGKAG
jgi:hypothetical protein